MTHEERKRFGKAVREARKKKGWSMLQLLVAAAGTDPTLRTSVPTLNRLENGGLLPSEEARGVTCMDTPHSVRFRAAVATALGLTVPTDVPTPAAKTAAPTPKKAPAVAVQRKNGMDAARAARDANRAAGNPQGRTAIPKMVKFYTSLTTDHGFSLGAIRATLRQLTALGISTEAVRGEIKQKFASYIDTLDV